jgi:hypothetical protein
MSRAYDFYGVCIDSSVRIRVRDAGPDAENLNDTCSVAGLSLMLARMATVSGAGAGTAGTAEGAQTADSVNSDVVHTVYFDIAPSLRLGVEDATTVLQVLLNVGHARTLTLWKVYAWRETFAAIGVGIDDVVLHAVKQYEGAEAGAVYRFAMAGDASVAFGRGTAAGATRS